MNTKEKVYIYIEENYQSINWEDLHTFSASAIAEQFNVSRNVVSQYLNELVEEKRLIKINSRPVIFVPRILVTNNYEVLEDTYPSLEKLQEDIAAKKNKSKSFTKLIGHEGSLNYLIDQCKSAVTYPDGGLSTLLLGVTGVGKSLIAQTMYDYGVEKSVFAKDSRFIAVNCSEYADNPELFLTNLFGNVKGAYTGASQERKGLLSLADGGVLFLDEIHCLRPECQEKLYLFMDKGIYHMIGDNEKWYSSKVFIIFATTEDPQISLLKPLMRRIPITCKIPSLAQRPKQEKKELLHFLLSDESKKIQKEIAISQRVYNLLIDYEFNGNIGEMKNLVKVLAASALMEHTRLNKQDDCIQIDLQHLPDYIIHEVAENMNLLQLDNDTFLKLSEIHLAQNKEKQLYIFNEHMIENYKKIQKENESYFQFIDNAKAILRVYLDELTFTEEGKKNVNEVLYQSLFENIRLKISQKFRISLTNTEVISLSKLLYDYRIDINSCTSLYNEEKQIILDCLEYIKKQDFENYNMTQEILQIISNSINIEFNSLGILDFYVYLKTMTGVEKKKETHGIVLAHGYSTASSITTTANHMLGSYVFDAIDMPMDLQATDIAAKLNAYIHSQPNISNIVMLVDMGSLEEIYKNINTNESVNIVIFNNVTLKLVLDIGFMITRNESITQIMNTVETTDYQNRHIYIETKRKNKAIITVCPTGIQTAEKLSQLLQDSLPEEVDMEIIAHEFSEIQNNQKNSDIYEQYDVQYIVGTANPLDDKDSYIPVEELIEKQNMDKIQLLFNTVLTDEQIDKFSHNLLRNFSLQNLLEYLTILNPEKIVSYTEEIIKELKTTMNPALTSSTVVGLYIHISCLIERLITDNYITKYDQLDSFIKEEAEFIEIVKNSFKNLEKHYCVEIPISEIAYIHDHIYRK
ncbi:sigma 54-interacting transcriptional regulator [Breznakia pachnodae]|uniref:Sigma-54 dependent transcriptional regulator of gfr operon n=1 Tax=Breznakia pachnodae TaxID=265178 RepID=A0ABU0DZQ8_9FIRM|nr:sigma 54-interacting transcriptional regulator [Breznakia pachnodae]MDQ0360118.1 sigma-54 dependent transcriptional regulator of gfr operon [Breznakia pachnodae]